MVTFWPKNIFYIITPLWKESAVTVGFDGRLVSFWKKTGELSEIWDTITLVLFHCNIQLIETDRQI